MPELLLKRIRKGLEKELGISGKGHNESYEDYGHEWYTSNIYQSLIPCPS